MTWRHRAACRGVDPNLFFCEGVEDGQYPPEVRATCSACPVQTECLLEHLNDPDYTHTGFVGGLSPIERRELRVWLSGRTPRRRAAATRMTPAPAPTGCPRCAHHHCLRPFTPHSPLQIYCSIGCSDAARRQQQDVA